MFYLPLSVSTNKWEKYKKLERLSKKYVGIPHYFCTFWKFKIISCNSKLNQYKESSPNKSIFPTHDPIGLDKKECRELIFFGRFPQSKEYEHVC